MSTLAAGRALSSNGAWRRIVLGLAVAALAITTACSGSADATPDATSDATPTADAAVADAVVPGPDAAPDVDAPEGDPDAAPEGDPDAAPEGDPDAGSDGGTPPTGDELTAIVALSNCSGSVVRFTTSLPTDHALVLTNGHCIGGGYLEAGEAIGGQPSSRVMTILEPDALRPAPPRGRPQGGANVEVQASELVYATMTSSDLALYRLTTTYGELERDHGVHAMTIADRRAEVGTEILIPSGYWQVLYACSIDAFVYSLREAGWLWEDSIRYSPTGCQIIGGTSGSPIVAVGSHEVVGVNNTTNEGGLACSLNNPCEVDEAGDTVSVPHGSYGQQVHWLYGCLSPANELDFTLPDCRLLAPTTTGATGARASRPEGSDFMIHPRAAARQP